MVFVRATLARLKRAAFQSAFAAWLIVSIAAMPAPHPAPPGKDVRERPPSAAFSQAIEAYYAGDLAKAAESLEKIAEQETYEATRARRNLVVIYQELGDLSSALVHSAHLAAREGDERTQLEHAWTLLAFGRAGEAATLFKALSAARDPSPWALFGEALTQVRLGETAAAEEALERTLTADPSFVLAWEELGRLRLSAGRHEEAIDAFLRALRLDPSLSDLNFELAKAYEALGNVDAAWRYYESSARIFPNDPEVRRRFEAFLTAHREYLSEAERARFEARSAIVPKRLDFVPEKSGVDVRVGLVEGLREVRILAGSSFRAVGESGDARLPGGHWTLRFESGVVVLAHEEHGEHRFSGDEIAFALEDPRSTWIIFDLEAGRGYFWSRREDLQVRGTLLALPRRDGFTLVNRLDLEEYLLAVVPSEVYPSMPIEALKAQAIASRTYTLRNLGRYASRGFDVWGNVASSAYRGVAREHPRTTEAVVSTRGEVLTYDGRIIEAYYHASAGGHTASSEDVWGGRREYLQARPEWVGQGAYRFPLAPWDLRAWLAGEPESFSKGTGFGLNSTYRWVRRINARTIAAALERRDEPGALFQIVPGRRGEGGWLKELRVRGTGGEWTIAGDTIRSRMGGLKSNAFSLLPLYDASGRLESVIVWGAGFGHGVGMSQMGAAGMAQRGMDAAAILDHYFPGARITSALK